MTKADESIGILASAIITHVTFAVFGVVELSLTVIMFIVIVMGVIKYLEESDT